MRKYSALVICILLACATARADSWALTPEVTENEFVFGDTRIVLHYDSTQDRQYPKYAVSIYRKDKLLGKHEDTGFGHVFASPDNSYFVGVSNRGLIKQAYVIFDRDGKLLKKRPHDPKKVHYFEVSKTLIRKWYDDDKPDPVFLVADGKLKDVRINACDGSRVSLLIPEDLGLRTYLLEGLLKTHAKPKENCYVSFGTAAHSNEGGIKYLDPPKRFLNRFKRRSFQVKPASAYPKPKKGVPFPPENPETGIPDGLYTVEVVSWLDESTARVRTSLYRHGLGARGESLVVEKRDGKWHVKDYGKT